MVNGELSEENDGNGHHSPRGVANRRLKLQVVATQRRVGGILWVGSTEEEVDGWWCLSVNRGGSREQRAERVGCCEGGGGEKGKTSVRRALYSHARRWTLAARRRKWQVGNGGSTMVWMPSFGQWD
jgi:hypothetical protein